MTTNLNSRNCPKKNQNDSNSQKQKRPNLDQNLVFKGSNLFDF